MKQGRITLLCTVLVATIGMVFTVQAQTPEPSCKEDSAFCYQPKLTKHLHAFGALSVPKVATPEWLATAETPAAPPASREVTYSVATKGTVTADVSEFKSLAATTYNSPYGWARLGV